MRSLASRYTEKTDVLIMGQATSIWAIVYHVRTHTPSEWCLSRTAPSATMSRIWTRYTQVIYLLSKSSNLQKNNCKQRVKKSSLQQQIKMHNRRKRTLLANKIKGKRRRNRQHPNNETSKNYSVGSVLPKMKFSIIIVHKETMDRQCSRTSLI